MSLTNLLICDDHKGDLSELTAIIKAYYNHTNCRISTFNNPKDALSFIENGNQIDIAILDVVMPGMTGIELATEMRALKYTGHLIFISSVNDFAAESYSVKAFSYILKPIKKAAIIELLEEIEKARRGSDTDSFKLTKRGGVRVVLYSELIYVEVISHNLNFHLNSGETVTVYGSLKEYAKTLLRNPRMAQCHRSYILNMDYINTFDNGSVTMRDGTKISITESYRDFKGIYFRYMFGDGKAML